MLTSFSRGRRLACHLLIAAGLGGVLAAPTAAAQALRTADLTVSLGGTAARVPLSGRVGGAAPVRELVTTSLTRVVHRVSLEGGNAECGIVRAEWKDADSQGLPAFSANHPLSVHFPQGLLDVQLGRCAGGSTVTLRLTAAEAFPAGTRWTYARTDAALGITRWVDAGSPQPGGSSSMAVGITDGGEADRDRTADGTVVHLGGPRVEFAAAPNVQPIPTLGSVALTLLILGFAVLAGWQAQRQARNPATRRLLGGLAAVAFLAFWPPSGQIPAEPGAPPANSKSNRNPGAPTSEKLPAGRLTKANSERPSATPTALFFYVPSADQSSDEQAIAIRNPGPGVLTIDAPTLGGANPNDFVLTSGCPLQLEAGSACTIKVSFKPGGTTPALPQLDRSEPAHLVANGKDQIVTIIGRNFLPGSVALAGKVSLTTRFDSAERLRATVSGSLLQNAGRLDLSVRQPDGRVSNVLNLTIQSPNPGTNPVPDPRDVAPRIDRGGQPDFFTSIRFLFENNPPIQRKLQPGTLDRLRVSVIRGRVTDPQGQPLAGVEVSVLGQPAIGDTLTRADGAFDLAVNGDRRVTLTYQKAGYLPLQRRLVPRAEQYAAAPDVILTPLDPIATKLQLGSTQWQSAAGSVTRDEAGTRQARVLMPPGTLAELQMADGSRRPLSQLTFRATEFTVGPNGLRAMPGELPPTSGYTYAVELSADEAIAAGAPHVQFSQPVSFYVDDFLGFEPGTVVPVGWYDLKTAQWIGHRDGRVIKLLGIEQGRAQLDVEGKGVAAGAAQLAALSISDDERAQLAKLFPVGHLLWRVRIEHFSSWDCNWPIMPGGGGPFGGPPPQWTPVPGGGYPFRNQPRRNSRQSCTMAGSIINAESQTLIESVPIAGTDLQLNWNSGWWPNCNPEQDLTNRFNIPLFGNEVPSGIKWVDITVQLAGQVYQVRRDPAPNLVETYIWNGLDGYGRKTYGRQRGFVTLSYCYPVVYTPSRSGDSIRNAWAQVPSETYTQIRRSDQQCVYIDRRGEFLINSPFGEDYDAWHPRYPISMSIGGWTLDGHQGLEGDFLYSGSGFRNRPPELDMQAGYRGRRDTKSGDRILQVADFAPFHRFGHNGLHLETRDYDTGGLQRTYQYQKYRAEQVSLLTAMVDRFGNMLRIERDGEGNPLAIVAPHGQRTELTVDNRGYLKAVTNPQGESWTLSYTANGRLESVTNPKQHTKRFEYDADGYLKQETTAEGGGWSLTRTARDNGFSASATTAEGRTTSYLQEWLSEDRDRRTVTWPSGAKVVTVTSGPFGDRESTLPTGVKTEHQRSADGQHVLLQAKTKQPSGLTRQESIRVNDPDGTFRRDPIPPFDPDRSVEQEYFGVSPIDFDRLEGRIHSRNNLNSKLRVDWSGNGARITSLAGRLGHIKFDSKGQPESFNYPGGKLTYEHDSRGRTTAVIRESQGETRKTTFTYDSNGNISSVTDPLGRIATYDYDSIGREKTRQLPGGRIISFTYDPNGNVTSVIPPGRSAHAYKHGAADDATQYTPPAAEAPSGQAIEYRYNKDRQLTGISRADGTSLTIEYNSSGKVQRLAAPGGSVVYNYDAAGRLDSIITSDGVKHQYEYDGALLTKSRVSAADGIQAQLSYRYDDRFRVVEQSLDGKPVAIARDEDGLLLASGDYQVVRGSDLLSATAEVGAVTTEYQGNAFGDPKRMIARTRDTRWGWSIDYTRDGVGRIVRQQEFRYGPGQPTRERNWTYTYSLAGQLESVSLDGLEVERYHYDGNGNRTHTQYGNASKAGSIDGQDRLQQCGPSTYHYTANGERSSESCRGKERKYTWDGFGELRGITLSRGGTSAHIDYVYDGLGRRIAKRKDGLLVQAFIYQSTLRPVAELNGRGQVIARFVYGDHPNVPEYMEKGGKRFRLLTDHLGSVRFVLDAESGEEVQAIEYDSYGVVLKDTNPGFQPFGFAGGLYDQDTGLARFGARDYDPRSGTWLRKDPAGLAGGLNVYRYADGDPINFVDRNGRFVAIPIGGLLFAAVIVGSAMVGAMIAAAIEDALNNGKDGEANPTPAPEAPGEGGAGSSTEGSASSGTDTEDCIENPTVEDDFADDGDFNDNSRKDKSKAKNRTTEGDKPASDKIGKKYGKRIEKDINEDARQQFHDMKEKGAPDRTLEQLKQDARDIYRQYGKDIPDWLQ